MCLYVTSLDLVNSEFCVIFLTAHLGCDGRLSEKVREKEDMFQGVPC